MGSDWSVRSRSEAGLGSRTRFSVGTVIHEITVPVVDGEYIFLEVTEQEGKDNPVGDGIDEEEPFSQRDNLNDSAWTSPIWFTRGG